MIGRFLTALAAGLLATSCASANAGVEWSRDLLKNDAAWFTSAEARAIADSVLLHQSPEGGWPKNTDLAAPPEPDFDERLGNTIDNDGTTVPIQFLAAVASAGGSEAHAEAALKGLDYLLEAQLPGGGWPQFYPLRGGYYDLITYNDDAMAQVMLLLHAVAKGDAPFSIVDADRRAAARAAFERGVQTILATQVLQNGELTAWCAQHDPETLAPAWARAFEPPSLSGSESVGVLKVLMVIEAPDPEIVAAVEAGIAWLEASALTGLRYETFEDETGARDRRVIADSEAHLIWARFYELETNRPIFVGRDRVIRYEFQEIEQERRAGYHYYGDWADELLTEAYPAWRARLGLDG